MTPSDCSHSLLSSDGELLKTLTGYNGDVYSFSFSPEGQRIVLKFWLNGCNLHMHDSTDKNQVYLSLSHLAVDGLGIFLIVDSSI